SIDVVVFIMGYSGMSDNWEIYQEVIRAMDRSYLSIIPVLSSATSCADLIDRVRKAGKFYFHDEVDAAKALGHIIRRPEIHEPQSDINNYDKAAIENILAAQGEYLSPAAVKDVLNAAGFHIPSQTEVFQEDNLSSACEIIGFPLAMKVIGPSHKSDVGGVKLGINDHEAAFIAWKELMAITDASGIVLQKMVIGTEVILGAYREQDFGHLIMFGLGGIYTEVLKDVTFALAPLCKEESMRMIRNIKSFPILEGVRGEEGVDLDLLSEYLMRLSHLVDDFPRIREIDLNPVKGIEDRLYVVDARIIQDFFLDTQTIV
ncbi:MAG: acetate--CoA ligase family protein, partial [Deltaproteobacteria bacterium]|nr:acetate--CoA ligase family protein [Deltaproteobacteria bacterium]